MPTPKELSMSIPSEIAKKLKRYKETLTNLNRRNLELFFRERQSGCINISKNPFNPKLEEEKFAYEEFEKSLEEKDLLKKIIDDGLWDLTRQFSLDSPVGGAYVKKIDKIRTSDRAFQLEYGVSGGWLLGPFLCWKSISNKNKWDLMISPLFKIPIDIEKNRDSKKQSLVLEDFTLELNATLQLALNKMYGWKLSRTEEEQDIEFLKCKLIEFLNSKGIEVESSISGIDAIPKRPKLSKTVKDDEGEVIERAPLNNEEIRDSLSDMDLKVYDNVTKTKFMLIDCLYIATINSSKATLVADYEDIESNINNNPILTELLTGSATIGSKNPKIPEHELDEYKEVNNFFISEIDSTQHQAVERCKKENAIIIKGPPGTGKSQTITNIISDYVARGKSVLFVAEKRAALDVVYSRLEEKGISNSCIVVHGAGLDKKQIYTNFQLAHENLIEYKSESNWNNHSTALDIRKTEINKASDALASIDKNSGHTIIEIFSNSAVYHGTPSINEIGKQLSKVDHTTLESYSALFDEAQDLCKKLSVNLQKHPWKTKKKNIYLNQELISRVNSIKDNIEKLHSEKIRIEEDINGLIGKVTDHKEFVENVQKITPQDINEMVTDLDKLSNFEPLIAKEREYTDLAKEVISNKEFETNFAKEIDEPVLLPMIEYFSIPRGLTRFLSPTYWKYRSLIKSKTKIEPSVVVENLGAPLKKYLDCLISRDKFRTLLEKSDSYESVASNDKLLEAAVEIPNVFMSLNTTLKFLNSSSYSLSDLVIKKIKLKDTLVSALECSIKLQENEKNHESEIVLFNSLTDDYHLNIEDPKEEQIKSIDDAIRTINDLDVLDELYDKVIKSSQILQIDTLGIINILECSIHTSSQWGEMLKSSYYKFLIDKVRGDIPEIRYLTLETFDKKREVFVEAESVHRQNAPDAVNEARTNELRNEPIDSSTKDALKKESAKKKSHLPIRAMLETSDKRLTDMIKIKKCWMMSPLSISQILPNKIGIFDLILFDEASQVLVEDAIPSIYRAKKMVVVGDPNQMPPTNFFSSSNDDDDEEDDDEDFPESLLDLTLAIYPEVELNWHYRSKKEALIAFSNRAFYGGRLITAPNNADLVTSKPIEFHRVKEGVYKSSKGNLKEAVEVVSYIHTCLKSQPEKTIGVIAMGEVQSKLIQEELYKRKEDSPELAKLIDNNETKSEGTANVGIFVKNLENVQGDERDIIIISVGYGPSSIGKKLRLNFGPLIKKGGESRLNVAVTRAKQKIHLFCSFDPSEIPIDVENFLKNKALTIFGRYLHYANSVSKGENNSALSILNMFDTQGRLTNRKPTRFAKHVKRLLEEKGLEVETEVGSGGYFIDLAIRNPEDRENFVLGVECDGFLFHSTQYARDRDKIRQDLLEARGWKILRIGSREWSEDPNSEIDRVLDYLEKIRLSRAA